jgi:hypothetical protein
MNLTMRLLLMISMLFGGSTAWSKMRYSEVLCNKPDYSCITIKSNQTWSSLYPNPEEQDIIRRVNRMNVRLRPGMIIAIPKKQDIDCVSTAFPRRADGNNGGAVMPYCMHFFKGYALHGSYDVPGYRASHGCVRMLIEDARWLNEEFVSTAQEDGKGTLVILDAPS